MQDVTEILRWPCWHLSLRAKGRGLLKSNMVACLTNQPNQICRAWRRSKSSSVPGKREAAQLLRSFKCHCYGTQTTRRFFNKHSISDSHGTKYNTVRADGTTRQCDFPIGNLILRGCHSKFIVSRHSHDSVSCKWIEHPRLLVVLDDPRRYPAALDNMREHAWALANEYLMVSVTVRPDDVMYNELMTWLTREGLGSDARHLLANINPNAGSLFLFFSEIA